MSRPQENPGRAARKAKSKQKRTRKKNDSYKLNQRKATPLGRWREATQCD